jgi:predicted metal-dependent peptidase
MEPIFDSLAKSTKTLMFKEPFYGMFLISLNKETSESIPTACVSKNNINCQLTINPTYWNSLDEKTKVAVLKHELLHIVFFHILMQKEFDDHTLLNIAADLEVNQFIEDEWKGEKWEGLELSSYKELNLPVKAGTRKYYELLQQVNENRKQQNIGMPNKGGTHGNDPNSNGQASMDDLKDMLERIKNGDGGVDASDYDGSSPEKSKIWMTYDAMKAGGKTVCSHELWKEFMDGLSEADKKLIQQQVNYQCKQIAEDVKSKNRGYVPSELKDYIDSLFEVVEPVLDWKSYVRRFGGSSSKVYTKKTRRKLNKRYAENPALKIKQRKNILVAIDTSGSVNKESIVEFFNEIHHIHKSGVNVWVADCDASVADVYEYKGKAPEFITGRGGTDFNPAIEYYNEHSHKFNTLIYLTDGECSAPTVKPKTPMLWVLCSDGVELKSIEEYPGAKVKITR